MKALVKPTATMINNPLMNAGLCTLFSVASFFLPVLSPLALFFGVQFTIKQGLVSMATNLMVNGTKKVVNSTKKIVKKIKNSLTQEEGDEKDKEGDEVKTGTEQAQAIEEDEEATQLVQKKQIPQSSYAFMLQQFSLPSQQPTVQTLKVEPTLTPEPLLLNQQIKQPGFNPELNHHSTMLTNQAIPTNVGNKPPTNVLQPIPEAIPGITATLENDTPAETNTHELIDDVNNTVDLESRMDLIQTPELNPHLNPEPSPQSGLINPQIAQDQKAENATGAPQLAPTEPTLNTELTPKQPNPQVAPEFEQGNALGAPESTPAQTLNPNVGSDQQQHPEATPDPNQQLIAGAPTPTPNLANGPQSNLEQSNTLDPEKTRSSTPNPTPEQQIQLANQPDMNAEQAANKSCEPGVANKSLLQASIFTLFQPSTNEQQPTDQKTCQSVASPAA